MPNDFFPSLCIYIEDWGKFGHGVNSDRIRNGGAI